MVPIRLIVSLVSRFWGHNGTYETTAFGTKEKDGDHNNTNINMQPNKEGEKAKGGWVLCNIFFGFCFVAGQFFPFYVSAKPIKFFITKNLVIIYKLHNIRFLPQSEQFCHNPSFY